MVRCRICNSLIHKYVEWLTSFIAEKVEVLDLRMKKIRRGELWSCDLDEHEWRILIGVFFMQVNAYRCASNCRNLHKQNLQRIFYKFRALTNENPYVTSVLQSEVWAARNFKSRTLVFLEMGACGTRIGTIPGYYCSSRSERKLCNSHQKKQKPSNNNLRVVFRSDYLLLGTAPDLIGDAKVVESPQDSILGEHSIDFW
jgi:hypothetical protein